MIQKSQYQTTTRARQLGNAITWLRNQNTQSMGLTATQSEAIRYILKNHELKSITASDLMDILQLSQSTVAGIIQRLEDKELITRSSDPQDARKSIISPTQKGLVLEGRLKESAVNTESILLRGMTAAEQSEFNRLLQIALDNINTVRSAGGSDYGR